MSQQYAETIEFLYNALPMFQRIGPAALKKDLTNTVRICEHLGNPHLKFRSVHVAGTNGKGSSSHMLASILSESGYRTGLYTSPHLKSFTERIRVNGSEVKKDFVVDFVQRTKGIIDEVHPSFFEITVAMAFEYFANQAVDVAVIEVGLGGRLDSTNVIIPEVSLITNIGWDHKDLLGDTLEKIAGEKAGIIKPGMPVVVSEEQVEVAHVFTDRALALGSDITFASRQYSVNEFGGTWSIKKENRNWIDGLCPALPGRYQMRNIPGVLATIDSLNSRGFTIEENHVRAGIENVVANTGLKGRWQVLQKKPLVICDTGHNVEGIREVVAQLESTPHERLHMILGFVKDKDLSAILSVLPLRASYYFCQANIPRALDAQILCEKAKEFGLHGLVIPDVNNARRRALEIASPDDLIFVGGSTFVVAEIDEL